MPTANSPPHASDGNGVRVAEGLDAEGRLDTLRRLMDVKEGSPLKVVGIGAGAWGTVFLSMIQDTYGHLRDKIDVRIWRRGGRALDKIQAQNLFSLINSREDIMRRLLRNCSYLKYVEGRIGDRILYADEVLRDGFCVNLPKTPVCPLQVSTDLQEVVWDADLVINGLPSTETKSVFEKIGLYWKERRKPLPVIVSLSKGVEAVLEPQPHIITPTLMIHHTTGVDLDKLLYLGGPNIAEEIFNKEYANARICGSTKWRTVLAEFFRQPHFLVWDNPDLVTHEVMGGLKNVYAIGAGMVSALTQESATSKAVYFSHCIAEMIFITHLISERPENLAGPLMADTYITLLKGRNSWYGNQLASGKLSLEMGDNFQGRGTIQGVSAVDAFFTVLSKANILVNHPITNEPIQPLLLCPILTTLHSILHARDSEPRKILDTLQDGNVCDPGLLTINSISKSSLSHLIERHSSFKVRQVLSG